MNIECSNCGCENVHEAHFCEDCGAVLKSDAAVAVATREGPLAPGEVVDDRFRVEAVLESGRIARYRVRATDTEAKAEPQLLLEAPRRGEGSLLLAQSRLLESIEHAGLFRPLQHFTRTDFDYCVGPWPGDRRLDEIIDGAKMSPDQVVHLAQQLLLVLESLHSQSVICRAVQPNRIWLDPDDNLTLDCWDRATHHDGPFDEEACVTPGFSAPELYGIGELDERCDLFSVGAVLYYAITGSRPDLESRETFFAFPRPDIPGAEPLVEVILKSVSKSGAARFADAAQMRDAIDRAAQGESVVSSAPLPAPVPVAAIPAAVAAPESIRNNGSAPVALVASQGPIVALKSHIGCVRSINQDACMELKFRSFEKSLPRDAHLIVVVDGMGGEAEGDKAASLALRSLAREIVTTALSLQDGRVTSALLPLDPVERNRVMLRRSLEIANRTIFEYSSQHPGRRGMGCTVTAVLLDSQRAIYGHVGDTRGYHFRDRLDRVTTDHSLVGRLVDAGTMTEEEARVSPQRSIIYRAMGTNPDVDVDIYDREVQSGDLLVLCSDGIWEYFQAFELEDILGSGRSPQALCDLLVEIVLSRGADDNATVAVVRV